MSRNLTSRMYKLSIEQGRELIDELDEMENNMLPNENKEQAFQRIADKWNFNKYYMKLIKYNQTAGAQFRRRYLMNITKEQILHITESIYTEYYNKKPDRIAYLDRFHEAIQLIIFPEKIILQFNLSLLSNVTCFAEAVHRILRSYQTKQLQIKKKSEGDIQ